METQGTMATSLDIEYEANPSTLSILSYIYFSKPCQNLVSQNSQMCSWNFSEWLASTDEFI